MTIRLATPDDIPAMMALEARNYVGNLDESERSDGFISILHPQGWFAQAVASSGLHVAVDGGDVAGFIAMTDPQLLPNAQASPILGTMLELTETLSFEGRPLAEQRVAFRGPVLIDRAARGRGLYSAFNAVTREAYRGRFEVAVLFVAADNPRSLHTTSTKLGAETLATFEVHDERYVFMAYRL